MQKPLDPLSFKKNVYDRPNQDWICGHAAEGHACPLGPDARGNCRATGECSPAKRDDRWLCTRNEARGGKCAQGPLPDGSCPHLIPPCQPVRSLRRARGMFVWLILGLTTGALLILFGTQFRRPWMNPGELINAHATSAAKCSDCHTLETSATAPRLVSLHSLGGHAREDSALCLKCHQLGEQPLRTHGLAPAAMTQMTSQLQRSPEPQRRPAILRVSQALAPHNLKSGELACATCHQEHHGANFDLARLTNAQCQVCHTVQFASLQHGHPEFAAYPSQRRTRIFFDHASHLQQHFAERKAQAPQGCQDCHLPGPAGRFMQVKNFNATCAACHSAQIKGEGMTVKGVAFFSVPGIDADSLAAKGISIGEWPKFADAKITPFMALLLDRQPAARAALEKLRGVDLLDLTKANSEQLAAAEQFAWEVKRLLFHLVVEGQSYLLKQMNGGVAEAGVEVPRAALLAAQKEWMPNLLAEMANYEKGIKPPLAQTTKPAPPSPTPAAPNEKSAGGDDSLVGGDDLTAASTPTPTPAPAATDDLTSGGDLVDATAAASPAPAAAPTTAPVPEAMPAEEWVAAGGWYRPQDSFTLYYRPVGHADPFLVAWLTAAAQEQTNAAPAEVRGALQKLADPQSPGLCTKCHTVDERSGATLVNWSPAQPQMSNRPFTTFNHSTHFSIAGDRGCQSCHALNPKSQYASFFRGPAGADLPNDTSKFQSNFAPISKMLCVECHRPQVAGDGCILCHRYHAAPAVAAGELAQVGNFRALPSKK
ncbi:MAG: hypothetical protein ACR2HH_09960 [Chthoniobacterales bacterium]